MSWIRSELGYILPKKGLAFYRLFKLIFVVAEFEHVI